jgi:hypothetical protein
MAKIGDVLKANVQIGLIKRGQLVKVVGITGNGEYIVGLVGLNQPFNYTVGPQYLTKGRSILPKWLRLGK